MDIATGRIIDKTREIYKATATNEYGNWEIWCMFITHAGIMEKTLDGLQNRAKTKLMSSLTA